MGWVQTKHIHKHDPPVQACRTGVVNMDGSSCLLNIDDDPSWSRIDSGRFHSTRVDDSRIEHGQGIQAHLYRALYTRCRYQLQYRFDASYIGKETNGSQCCKTIRPNQSGELALTTTLSTFLTHLLRLHKPFLSKLVPSSHPLLGRDLALCFLGPPVSTSSMGIS